MGNCLSCYSSGKKGKNSQVQEVQNVSISFSQAEANINQKKQIFDEKTINRNEDLIKRRRNEFIDNFFQKSNTLNAIEKRNSMSGRDGGFLYGRSIAKRGYRGLEPFSTLF